MAAGPYKDEWLWSVDPGHYAVHEMGDAILVYNRRSGATHILNLVSSAMLDFLAATPRSLADAVDQFPDFLEVPKEECPEGVTRRIFAELDEAGFIVRAGQ